MAVHKIAFFKMSISAAQLLFLMDLILPFLIGCEINQRIEKELRNSRIPLSRWEETEFFAMVAVRN